MSVYRTIGPLVVILISLRNKNKMFRSFKSIRKAEDGPYLGLCYKSNISDPIRSGKSSQRKILPSNVTTSILQEQRKYLLERQNMGHTKVPAIKASSVTL